MNFFKKFFSKSNLELKINDGGRAAAGYKGKAGDCVVRSIAIVTNLPYQKVYDDLYKACLLYTSPSPRDRQKSRMPSSA